MLSRSPDLFALYLFRKHSHRGAFWLTSTNFRGTVSIRFTFLSSLFLWTSISGENSRGKIMAAVSDDEYNLAFLDEENIDLDETDAASTRVIQLDRDSEIPTRYLIRKIFSPQLEPPYHYDPAAETSQRKKKVKVPLLFINYCSSKRHIDNWKPKVVCSFFEHMCLREMWFPVIRGKGLTLPVFSRQ